GVTPQPKEEQGEMPEWVSQAAESQVPEALTEEPPQAEPKTEAEPAEIPDWLQALEPENSEEGVTPQPKEEQGEMPEWVSQAAESQVPEALTEEPPQTEPKTEAEPAEIPDWMQALKPQSSVESDEAQAEAQIPIEDETWFSEGPPILGDTKPVKVKTGTQPPVEEPESEPEEGTKAEAEALSQEAHPAAAETGQAPEEMEEEAEPDEITAAAQAEQQTEIDEEPEAVAGLEAEVAQETSQEPVEEPAAVVDEWRPEEPEAEQSEDVASMLSEMQESDDAFAWLESLAVRQGADEALLLNPEERSETPPEWVQAEVEEDEGEPEQPVMVESDTAEEAISPEETTAIEAETGTEELQAAELQTAELPAAEWGPEAEAAVPEEETPAGVEAGEPTTLGEPGELEQPVMEEPDTAEEGISPEETSTMEAETVAEDLQAADLQAADLQAAELQTADLQTAELPAADRGSEAEAAVPEEETQAGLEAGEPTTLGEPSALEQPEAEAESGEEIPELPDWLQESATESDEETAWTPPTVERPLEKLDLNQASLVELERLPDIGFRMAQNIVSYRDSFGTFRSVDDLLNIPGMGPEMLDDLRDWLYVTSQRDEPTETPVSPFGEVKGGESPSGEAPPEVLEARQQVTDGDLEQAAQSYTQLIQNNLHLDVIIQDLQVATEHNPHTIILWQALGDAHLRAGQIQPALDAYNQAEKLLS
ncbi:MAG: helix-hairpin-helix domain-containing protein, partial [Anaerolineales bacterium]